MSNNKPSGENQVEQLLLVEGLNDQHVVWALAKRHQLPQTFSVEIPEENNKRGGISLVLDRLRVELKRNKLKTLGIVIDADRNIDSQWQRIKDILVKSGYPIIPDHPQPEGWIQVLSDGVGRLKIGVWLMPNNQLPGILEDFVKALIPENDLLLAKAEAIIQEIEQEQLNRYSQVDHAKALIHTWLAWQKEPGQPMGQAITAKALQSDTAIAAKFVDWLNQLFNPIDQ
jgi:hypothetical protein